MEISWIQRYALFVLMRHKTARIKELIPQGVPANLFSYHIEKLVSAGYLAKVARGTYRLSSKGEIFVGSMSTESESSVKDLKTVVMFYGKKNEKYLLFKWSRQPYLGQTTLPYDRLIFGSSLSDGVIKAIKDKLGVNLKVTYKSSVMVRIFKDTELISHMNALIYEINIDELTLPYVSRNGELFLANINDVDHINGLENLVNIIEKKTSMSDIILTY